MQSRISKHLCHFLKEKGLFVKFSYYYRKYNETNSRRQCFITIADIPFDKTDEGICFWQDVEKQYQSYLINQISKLFNSQLLHKL